MDKKIIIAIVLAILIGFASGWFLCRHYDTTEQSNGDSAISTVEQLESNNESASDDNSTAGTYIESAQGEIESAQSELQSASTNVDDARQSVSDLKESINNSTGTTSDISGLLDQLDASIRASKDNIATERNIINSVDGSNKTDGTSCSSTKATT